MKGLRIGLSGTSLALAVAGCHKAPADEPIVQEAPAGTVETASTVAPRDRQPDEATSKRDDGAPPASPFLVSPNRQASVTSPNRDGEPVQQVAPLPTNPPVANVRPQGQNRPGWKNRIACACGRG